MPGRSLPRDGVKRRRGIEQHTPKTNLALAASRERADRAAPQARRHRSRVPSPRRQTIEIVLNDERQGMVPRVHLRESAVHAHDGGVHMKTTPDRGRSAESGARRHRGEPPRGLSRRNTREEYDIDHNTEHDAEDTGDDEDLGPGRSTNPAKWEALWARMGGGA